MSKREPNFERPACMHSKWIHFLKSKCRKFGLIWKVHIGKILRKRKSTSVCVVCPTQECTLHCRRQYDSNVDVCSALTVIEQYWLACHTYCDTRHPCTVYLRRPLAFTSVAGRLTVELSQPAVTTLFCGCWNSNIQPSACEANALSDCACATVCPELWNGGLWYPLTNFSNLFCTVIFVV